jgi:hypothetical protein
MNDFQLPAMITAPIGNYLEECPAWPPHDDGTQEASPNTIDTGQSPSCEATRRTSDHFCRVFDFAKALERRRARTLTVSLSPLVSGGHGEDDGLITRTSHPHAIDLIAFEMSKPLFATRGEVRRDSGVDHIGIMCGRRYLYRKVGSVEIYYNLDFRANRVEIEAVFRSVYMPDTRREVDLRSDPRVSPKGNGAIAPRKLIVFTAAALLLISSISNISLDKKISESKWIATAPIEMAGESNFREIGDLLTNYLFAPPTELVRPMPNVPVTSIDQTPIWNSNVTFNSPEQNQKTSRETPKGQAGPPAKGGHGSSKTAHTEVRAVKSASQTYRRNTNAFN